MTSDDAEQRGTTRHNVTITAEHRRRLLEAFPAPTVTDALRASSFRGIEAVEASRGGNGE